MVAFDLKSHKKILVRKECLDLDFRFAGSYADAYICDNLKMGAGEVSR